MGLWAAAAAADFGSDETSARVARREGGSLGGKEELSGRRSERDEKNLREMSEREEEKN